MIYFLASANKPDSPSDNPQESNQTFSKINLIALTPKSVTRLMYGVLALSSLAFFLGIACGWAFATDTKTLLAVNTVLSSKKAALSAEPVQEFPVGGVAPPPTAQPVTR